MGPLLPPDPPAPLVAPPLRRRMACWLYEGLLMFGVVFIAGYLFGTLTQTRHALDNRHALQAFLFVIFGIYFTWFWSRGHTLAMKTWHIRVVDRAGQPLSQPRALGRYVLSWLWFLPPLAVIAPFHLSGAEISVLLLGWVAVWALLSRLHPEGQFLHDALAGTRLIHHEVAPRALRKRKTPPMPESVPEPSAAATHKRRTGLVRLLHATRYSLQGLADGWAQKAFRLEACLAAGLLPLAVWLGRDWLQTAFLAATVVLVLITELLNSGIEAAIDRIGTEWHELSRSAKDMGSAAVLLSVLLCGGSFAAALYQRTAWHG